MSSLLIEIIKYNTRVVLCVCTQVFSFQTHPTKLCLDWRSGREDHGWLTSITTIPYSLCILQIFDLNQSVSHSRTRPWWPSTSSSVTFFASFHNHFWPNEKEEEEQIGQEERETRLKGFFSPLALCKGCTVVKHVLVQFVKSNPIWSKAGPILIAHRSTVIDHWTCIKQC